MARVTVIDVAKRAGVSKSTVSLVLNHSSRVQPETADKVRAAIDELNYVPSRAARMLQSGRSRQLGIIVSDITNPYFAELVRSVTNAASVHDLDVMTLDTDYSPALLLAHLERLYQYRCDGLLVLTTEREPAAMATLRNGGVPAIVLNWGEQDDKVSQISVDYRPGLNALVSKLAADGHRRLAFVCGSTAYHTANLKKEAFCAACLDQGEQLGAPLYLAGDTRLNLETGQRLADELLATDVHERPTAVVVNNDVTALGLLRALQSRQVKVPGDISIAGIDDIDAAAFVTPSLTSIRQPRRYMGQLAVAVLCAQIDAGIMRGVDENVPSRLVLRESTGAAAVSSKLPPAVIG